MNEFEKLRSLTPEEKELLIRHIMSGTFMDLRCDWAFKHVMRDEAILKMLLNDVLPEEVDEIDYDPNEIDRFSPEDKDATMDVLCHSRKTGKSFIVEIQQKRKISFRDRMFYYGAAMLASKVKRSEEYTRLRPVYVLCFMDFTYQHLSDQLVYRYAMREEATHELYGNQLNIYFFEMPRLRKESMDGMNPLEGWLYLLRNLHNFAEVPQGMDKRYARVVKAARMTMLPGAEQTKYLRAMISENERKDLIDGGYEYGFEQGVAQGIEQGIEQGVAQSRAEIAKAMLSEGMDVDAVAKYTGLSQEAIEMLSRGA